MPILPPSEAQETCAQSLDRFVDPVSGDFPEREPTIGLPAFATFQGRAFAWAVRCFGGLSARDRQTRACRFLEEALEVVQAAGLNEVDAHDLVFYVFGRPAGDIRQEVGGVLLTLATLCTTASISMAEAGEAELGRVSSAAAITRIREKEASKPADSSLPGVVQADADDQGGDLTSTLRRHGI